jgi:NADH-quinone oxidoreductase subunit C
LSSDDSTAVATTGADASTDVDEPEPRDERREHLLSLFEGALGDAIVDSHIRPGAGLWIRVTRDAWKTAASTAKDHLGFRFFDFLSAIDWLPSPFGRDMDSQEDVTASAAESGGTASAAESGGTASAAESVDPEESVPMTTGLAGGDTRFQLLARVYDTRNAQSVIFKADLPDDDLRAESWASVYHGADWHERETWEMFGIVFENRSKLDHIYLPSQFEGHPLRKDFPLLARRVKPWPGIVDVEPMPGSDDDDDGEDDGEGDSE